MDRIPFAKRKRIARSPEEHSLALLNGLLESDVHLAVRSRAGVIELLSGNSLVISVPQRLTQRCKMLQQAPEGLLEGIAEMFAFWLAHIWRAELQGSPRPCKQRAKPTDDDVNTAFELIKAANFLQDDMGVDTYSQTVHGYLLDAPVISTLPIEERLHTTGKHCPLPLRLLTELPEDLVREIVAVKPYEVLIRLPIGYSLAKLCCDLYNQAAWDCENACVNVASLKSFRASELWTWLSAVAQHADTQIDVRASYSQWRQSIKKCVRGLRVLDMRVDKEEAS